MTEKRFGRIFISAFSSFRATLEKYIRHLYPFFSMALEQHRQIKSQKHFLSEKAQKDEANTKSGHNDLKIGHKSLKVRTKESGHVFKSTNRWSFAFQ